MSYQYSFAFKIRLNVMYKVLERCVTPCQLCVLEIETTTVIEIES